jgi:hypothetical protein
VWEFSHPEVVDDQDRDCGQIREIGFASPLQGRVGELLEQRGARFGIDGVVASQLGREHARANRTNGKTGLTTAEREELARLRERIADRSGGARNPASAGTRRRRILGVSTAREIRIVTVQGAVQLEAIGVPSDE